MIIDLLSDYVAVVAAKRFRFVRKGLWLILALGLLVAFAPLAFASEIPDVVRQRANAFERSQATPERLRPGHTLLEDYAYEFFVGFTHENGGIYTPSALARDAYTQGQAYWRDHPSERAQIFAGYGYTAVEREGVWIKGFEISSFEPSDSPGERWWMTSLGNGPWREVGLDAGNTRRGPLRLRIDGYLSPKGSYGHLGMYGHTVLVTAATVVEADAPAH